MWWRTLSSEPQMGPCWVHVRRLVSFPLCPLFPLFALLGACQPASLEGTSTVQLMVEVSPTPPEGPLSLWEASPVSGLPLRGDPERDERWGRLPNAISVNLSDALSGEREAVALYQSEGLWRSLTALSIPAEWLSTITLDGAWLHERLGHDFAEDLSALLPADPLLYPLTGLDYRARAIPLAPPRQARYLLTPWSLLPWALSGEWVADEPGARALQPIINALSEQRVAWSALAERLGLPSGWSLVQLVAQLSAANEREALLSLGRELAFTALIHMPQVNPEVLRALSALPCIFASLSEPEELTRVISTQLNGQLNGQLNEPSALPCALPADQAWIHATPSPLSGAQEPQFILNLSASGPPEATLTLRVERLPPSPRRDQLSGLKLEAIEALRLTALGPLEGCSGEGAELRCEVSWRDAYEGQLTLLVTAYAEGGAPLGGRVLQYTLDDAPAWALTIAALGRPHLIDERGSAQAMSLRWAPLSHPTITSPSVSPPPQQLTFNHAGVASLPRVGRSPNLSVELESSPTMRAQGRASLWSPFPAPGHWRALRSGERLAASLLEPDLLSVEDLERGDPLTPPLTLLSPLQTRLAEHVSAEGLSWAARRARAAQLSAAVLTLLGGAGAPLSAEGLTTRLEALAQSPELLYELVSQTEGAEAQGWSQEERAHLRAWLCIEAAEQGAMFEPPTRAPDGEAGDPLELNAEWLDWLSLGCLLGALSAELPEPAVGLSPEALVTLIDTPMWVPGATHQGWLSHLFTRLHGYPSVAPARVTWLKGSSDAKRFESLSALEEPAHVFNEALEGRPYLISIESAIGLSSLSLQYLEAPWLTDSTTPPPTPLVSARLIDGSALSELELDYATRGCLWRLPPLSALSASWQPEQSWREATPLTDPRWRLERTLEVAEPHVDPCHVALMINAAALPEGPYLLKLSVGYAWGAQSEHTLSFTVDRQPLTASISPSDALSSLDEELLNLEGSYMTHAHFLLTDASSALGQEGRLSLAQLQLSRPARCELREPLSLSLLPPRLPARFTEGQEPFNAAALRPNSQGDATEGLAQQWNLSAQVGHEGSGRVGVSCEDSRGERATISLDLTFDQSPPQLRALWLTQASETELSALRFGENGGRAPRVGWLLYTQDPPELLRELLPSRLIDLSLDSASAEQRLIERWRGWWGEPLCSDELDARCLLAGQGPCEGALEASCLERSYPLTLHGLVYDEQWETSGHWLSLSALFSVERQPTRSYSHWAPQAEALDSGFSHIQLPLNAPWALGLWPEPPLEEAVEMTLKTSASSPAWPQPERPTSHTSLYLRSLTPPPLLEVELNQLPSLGAPIEDLSTLRSAELISAQLYNPHPDPLWLRTSPALTQLSLAGWVDRVTDTEVLSSPFTNNVTSSCLWDAERQQASLDSMIPSDERSVEALTQLLCIGLYLPLDERYTWQAELEWSLSSGGASRGAWRALLPGERLTVQLNARWSLPVYLERTLAGLAQLPPPRAQHYVYPHIFSGFFWSEPACVRCSPRLLFGRPYLRLRQLSYEADDLSADEALIWSVSVSSDPSPLQQVGDLSLFVGALPSAFSYELSDP